MNLPSSDLTGLAQLAESCDLGLWYTRASGHTEWNLSVREHLWLPLAGEVTPEDFFQGIDPQDRTRVRSALEQSALLGGFFRLSFRTPQRGGQVRFIQAAGRTRRSMDGELVLVEGQTVDETSHVQAQAKLAALSSGTPALLWVMEPDGFCSFFSQSWYDFTGQTPQEALGRGWQRTVHPDDLEPTTQHALRAVNQRSAFESVHRLRHRDGQWRWMLCVGQPRFSPSGEFLGHAGAVTDIHERKLAEQRMRESERRYRSFVANSSDGIWRVEFDPPIDTSLPVDQQAHRVLRQSAIAECNDAFARMHGFDAGADLIGQPVSRMLPPDMPGAVAFISALIAGGYGASALASRQRSRDGRDMHFSNSITGVVEDGRLLRAWGIQTSLPARAEATPRAAAQAAAKDPG